MTERSKALIARIKREREALNLAPWEFAPSQVQDRECPYPPGRAGYESWASAQKLWREMQAEKRKAKRAKAKNARASKKS